jgi:predicted outer membrane lipoprotein
MMAIGIGVGWILGTPLSVAHGVQIGTERVDAALAAR